LQASALEWINSDHSNSYIEVDGVPYIAPEHSKNQVKKAGNVFVGKEDGDIDHAETVLGNWRAAHSYPLQLARITLRNRCKRYDFGYKPIVVQRLKRRASIKAKLVRFPRMKLSTMQDIAGCRAIVGDMDGLVDLTEGYLRRPPKRFRLVGFDDYVITPKPDGYRSTHIIYEYSADSETMMPFNGLKVELQLRTQIQHAWATAVEVVSVFTKQNLKAGIGDDKWKRFFYLASDLLMLMERPSPHPPIDSFMPELYSLWNELNIEVFLKGCVVSHHTAPFIPSRLHPHKLMILNTIKKGIQVHGFQKGHLTNALRMYDLLEREHEDDPHILVLLVTGDSMTKLEQAYPNFYLDTTEFLDKMTFGIQLWEYSLKTKSK